MQKTYWENRWKTEQIGFHQELPNPNLVKYFSTMAPIPEQSTVFVPCCGKSQDLSWMAEQKCKVVGCELSELAVEQFFTDRQETLVRTKDESHQRFQSGNIILLQGDMFSLSPEKIGRVDAVFDRASIVAFPPSMRTTYAQKIKEILVRPGSRYLLITFEYDQNRKEGPPFCVPESEIRKLYGAEFSIELLEDRDILDEMSKEKYQGLDSFNEQVYLLTRKE